MSLCLLSFVWFSESRLPWVWAAAWDRCRMGRRRARTSASSSLERCGSTSRAQSPVLSSSKRSKLTSHPGPWNVELAIVLQAPSWTIGTFFFFMGPFMATTAGTAGAGGGTMGLELEAASWTSNWRRTCAATPARCA